MSDTMIQVLTIIGSNLVMVIGMLSVTVGIWVHQDKKIDEHRKETNDILKAIQEEIKDFHGRLCEIEGKRK